MKRYNLLIVFTMLICNILTAHNKSFGLFNFSYLTEDAGLSHNYVDDIYKDSQGYIWFATHNGLTRYDGYNFLIFNSATTPISLKGDLIYKICEDKYNRLWVASERGIDIIDLEKYCNIQLPIDQYSTIWNMMNTNTTHIYKDSNNDLWISAANNLYCLEFSEDGNIANYHSLEKGISSSTINAVADLGWGICAGINNSLVSIEKGNNHVLTTKIISEKVDKLYDDWKIQALEVDGDNLWIGTNYGLYNYDHFNQKFTEYNSLTKQLVNNSQLHITDIKKNTEGLLFRFIR